LAGLVPNLSAETSRLFEYITFDKGSGTFRDLLTTPVGFVNNQLALDVGGQHQALEGTIDFDKQASALGITVGQTYSMDIFHAERQTTESNFRIETNIKCFEPVDVVK